MDYRDYCLGKTLWGFKYIISILTVLTLSISISQAQCPSQYFNSQSDIDNFPINFPQCTDIEGNVSISGDDITNLNGLSIITSISGNLTIDNNPSLSSLEGLYNLTSIGASLSIHDNELLTEISALSNVSAFSAISSQEI